MKQVIVLVAMIFLGLVLAGLIGNFGKSAEKITGTATSQIEQMNAENGVKE